MKSPDYEIIFQDYSKHYAFDERSNFLGRRLFSSKNPKCLISIYSKIEIIKNKIRLKFIKINHKDLIDFTRITEDLAKNSKIRLFRKDLVRSDLWHDKKDHDNWEIEWNAGNLKDKTENLELFHFHFIKSKSNPSFKINQWFKNKLFLITEHGISIPD